MNWRPLPGWLLVEPVDTEDKLGSLYVPQQTISRMTRTQYTVLASGGPAPQDPDDDPETPGEFKAGDWVVAPQRVAFHVQEESVTFLSERNVWCIIETTDHNATAEKPTDKTFHFDPSSYPVRGRFPGLESRGFYDDTKPHYDGGNGTTR